MKKLTKNKFIDFIITQNCTYSCSYCSQSKNFQKEKKNANDETINSFYKLLSTLNKDYEITITGGEALLHPKFFEIIEATKNFGFKINLITNFSFKKETYEKIFNVLGDNLNRFDISFHLDEIKDFNSTIEKLEEIINLKPKKTKTVFLIPIYKIDNSKDEKIKKILSVAKKYDLDYDFQHIRLLNKYEKQTEKEEKYFKNSNNSFSKKRKAFASICSAGSNSAVIYENGECYRCYSSRFLKTNNLGNIKDKNFSLMSNSAPCANLKCTCPKPFLYNQISDRKNYFLTGLMVLKNAGYLPILFFKKRRIVLEKLKQYFSLKLK